jgi:hypothetical protein
MGHSPARPLFLLRDRVRGRLRKGLPGRPSFMLRDQQVYDYATDAELIGRAVRVTHPYRRFLQT